MVGREICQRQLVRRSRYPRRPRPDPRRQMDRRLLWCRGWRKAQLRSSYFDEEIKFTGELNFAKLTGWEPLEGLKGFGEVRWRDGLNPNLRVGASSNFQPSHFQSGKQWRLMTFGLTYTTPELFGAKEFLTVTGGWIQPQKEFIEQPLSKLFVNNAFESSKGIGANIPFSSSFSTWGGTLKIKPVDWYYAKAGALHVLPPSDLDRQPRTGL